MIYSSRYQDERASFFQLTINGAPIPPHMMHRFSGVMITEEEGKKALLEFTILDDDASLFDAGIIDLNDVVWLLGGYPAKAEKRGPFSVVEVSPSFKGLTLEIRVKCESAGSATRKSNRRVVEKGTIKEVFTTLAEAHDMKLVLEPGFEDVAISEEAPVVQAGESDAAFMLSLAAKYGLLCTIRDNEIRLGPPLDVDDPSNAGKIRTLKFRTTYPDVESFQVKWKKPRAVGPKKKSVEQPKKSVFKSVADFLKNNYRGPIVFGVDNATGQLEPIIFGVDQGYTIDVAFGSLEGTLETFIPPFKVLNQGDWTKIQEFGKELAGRALDPYALGSADASNLAEAHGFPTKQSWRVRLDQFGYAEKYAVDGPVEDDFLPDKEGATSGREGEAPFIQATAKHGRKRLVDAGFEEGTLKLLLGSMEFRTGMGIRVDGAGQKLSGPYRIAKVTHRFDQVFDTELVIKRPKPSKKKAASGQSILDGFQVPSIIQSLIDEVKNATVPSGPPSTKVVLDNFGYAHYRDDIPDLLE